MSRPNKVTISVGQIGLLVDEIKEAASLALKKDSFGTCNTEAVRKLMGVCDALEELACVGYSSGSSTDRNLSTSSGNS